MTELVFPVVGTLVVFLIAVPLFTVIARGVLYALPIPQDSIEGYGTTLRYLVMIAPVGVPMLWLVSASVHQTETGESVTACAIDHLGTEICRDVVLFGVGLVLVFLGTVVIRTLRSLRGHRRAKVLESVDARVARIRAICDRHRILATFSSRVHILQHAGVPMCTRGLFRPWIEIDSCLLDQLTDVELEGALLHEYEHARAGDPVGYLVGQLTLAVNPFSHLLEPDYARYRFAREALCDRRAVQLGADPLALARTIVAVAGKGCTHGTVAALGGTGMNGVRVRVQLLFDYAARGTGNVSPPARWSWLLFCTVVLIGLPHAGGTEPLDLLHEGIEQGALNLLERG